MNSIKRKYKGSRSKQKRTGPNKMLLALILSMLTFGAVMIFDASVYVASQPPFNNEFYFLIQQLVWILVGAVPAILIYNWDYKKLAKVSLIGVLGTIALLIAVLILGEEVNGSKRWFQLGPIPIQPSEFAKPILIVYLSAWLSTRRSQIPTLTQIINKKASGESIIFMGLTALTLVLVLMEPDLGTTMILGATAFTILLASSKKVEEVWQTLRIAAGAGVLGLIAAVAAPYRLGRVQTFIDLFKTGEVQDPSGTGYQIYQILIGISSAGWLGVGFGQSRQRFGYLVENTAFTDSIFAVFLEELGIPGALLLIGAWLLFFVTGLQVANKSRDQLGKIMAIGITFWLTFQALLNMAANVGLMPLTGLPLPFFTYGGSNTIVTMVGAAILLNISRYNDNGRAT